ncbi:phage virion morphogenesis protein [Pseudomonas protegens]|uniref:phage virion morphogenesis protein n=1 Tax=Pseudomonas protegens TaxID=380021 RepID=UPI003209AC9B
MREKQGWSLRKQAMFKKLRTAPYLTVRGNSNSVTEGFTGRVARVARVQQYGLIVWSLEPLTCAMNDAKC